MKSKLEELIEKLCPNGVEYRELEKIITIVSPPKKILSKNITLQGKYPVIDQGADYISGYTDDTEALLPDNNYIIFGDHTEIIKYVDFKFAQGADGIKILITKDFDCKYLYYCFTNFYEPTGKYTRHWSKAKTTLIPLPPLEIQEEIVRILDKFTELTIEIKEELTTELILRKQQYEHYRDELLTFGDEVKKENLEKCTLKIQKVKWNNVSEEEYNYIDLSSVNRDNNKIYETQNINSTTAPSRAQQIVLENDIIFGTTRPLLKRYCIIPKEYNNQICSTGFCVLRADENIVLPKWIFYLISTSSFYAYVEKNQKGTSYPAISDTEVKKFEIPLPPLEEQKRIVEILDRFDKYINDIKEGLPAEIEMRQKQYEHYRKELLDFKKLNMERSYGEKFK